MNIIVIQAKGGSKRVSSNILKNLTGSQLLLILESLL